MSDNGTTNQNKGRRTQRPSALQNVCNPAALSTACRPGTYEGSPSPYDNTMAEDDSAAVTDTGGPPSNQYMMSTAVPWDHGATHSASASYVNQQPGPHQQTMQYEATYCQGSYTGVQGGGHVVDQQPGPTAPMGYNYYGQPSGEGQPPSGQQHGWPQQPGYPQQGSQPHGSQQHGYQQYDPQQDDSQQHGYQQDGHYGGGGSSG